MAFQGIDVRQSGDRILFRAFLVGGGGGKITSGTTTLYLYELQNDGTVKSYDFNDNTFKTTVLTSETQALTHRTGNNGGTNTGLWTYALTTLTGFTTGAIYIAHVTNSAAFPVWQSREFQFAGMEGTIDTLSADAALKAIVAAATGKATETDGSVVFKAVDGTTTALTVVHDSCGNRTASTIA